jgi:flagellar protein FliJ
MAFHFPLQAVFHFRQSVEHQQELRLRAANQQVARVRHVLDQIDDRIRQVQIRESQELGVGTTSAELRFALGCEAALRQQRQDAERELLRWQSLRDQQQKIFQQARRERETFESLRDHQLREYQRDAARREQRLLDDFFLLRQAYLRRG